jgi:hypothetical protein
MLESAYDGSNSMRSFGLTGNRDDDATCVAAARLRTHQRRIARQLTLA